MHTAKQILNEWLDWGKKTLLVLGVVFIYHCIALRMDYYTPFRSVELNEIYTKLDDLAYAMAAAQEDILELHKRVKK